MASAVRGGGTTGSSGLKVIALVSGGKDSFYSLLHCQANGHEVVALANLFPPPPQHTTSAQTASARPAHSATRQDPPAQLPPHGSPVGAADSCPEEVQSNSSKPISSSNVLDDGSVGVGAGGQQQEQPHDEGNEDDAPAAATAQEETDLNSFMYQTVGHQVIPLYAQATGLPLYRHPIVGTAVDHGISYRDPAIAGTAAVTTAHGPASASSTTRPPHSSDEQPGAAADHGQGGGNILNKIGQEESQGEEPDETESLVPLLRSVLRHHPDANALCSGAILSTYQRTRVESVALRLGLAPLAFLWQYTRLPAPFVPPPPSGGSGDTSSDALVTPLPERQPPPAQLLRDMAAAGLEARIVKVASAGLDEDFLWGNAVKKEQAIGKALNKFGGGGEGAVLGEGGEFETLVVDGPRALFRGRVVVGTEGEGVEEGSLPGVVVREGGGSAWLRVEGAKVEIKQEQTHGQGSDGIVRLPDLWDLRFRALLDAEQGRQDWHVVFDEEKLGAASADATEGQVSYQPLKIKSRSTEQWCFIGSSSGDDGDDATSQTRRLVDAAWARLQARQLPATAVTNSIIVLRHMSDFPAINAVYASLFSAHPNPPARVTISCGERLPAGSSIAIYLTVFSAARDHDSSSSSSSSSSKWREGLHVQSRSYWAPANIGPYSQAVSYPLTSAATGLAMNTATRAVSIAGQIPLIPASMALPSPANGTAMQVILALQHLWRVGAERRVRWWTSAVAYFAAVADEGQDREGKMQANAFLAAQTWRRAHLWSYGASYGGSQGSSGEYQPDLWDRKFNPAYRSYASAVGDEDESSSSSALPDWRSIVELEDDDYDSENDDEFDDEEDEEKKAEQKHRRTARARNVPPMFTAEVQDLPRGAEVEWHAHIGLTGAGRGAVHQILSDNNDDNVSALRIDHIVIRGDKDVESGGMFVQSIAVLPSPSSSAEERSGNDGSKHLGDKVRAASRAMSISLRRCGLVVDVHGKNDDEDGSEEPLPYLVYADGEKLPMSATPITALKAQVGSAVVPCRSLWDALGRRLAMVALFETRLGK